MCVRRTSKNVIEHSYKTHRLHLLGVAPDGLVEELDVIRILGRPNTGCGGGHDWTVRQRLREESRDGVLLEEANGPVHATEGGLVHSELDIAESFGDLQIKKIAMMQYFKSRL